ncbi:SDR family NAD(P)-dependent oxidoreductase [Dactylosporangium sp. NPDC051541]|uniref:SDR family NAD(P)-dependent oxidoreductase n=1 Tax=Dactylosporangium sp. NPDC051541 TaxID=3363977 RepID=UPI0037B1F3D5
MQQDFAARPGVAVVTGATGGIGAAVARMLAARGCTVVLAYRSDATAAAALAAELNATRPAATADNDMNGRAKALDAANNDTNRHAAALEPADNDTNRSTVASVPANNDTTRNAAALEPADNDTKRSIVASGPADNDTDRNAKAPDAANNDTNRHVVAPDDADNDTKRSTVAPDDTKRSVVVSDAARNGSGRGAVARIVQADLTDPAACAALIAAAGEVHTLVHAAGPHVPMVHLSRVGPEQFAQQIAQDVLASFNIVHAALPALRAAHGSIVVVTTAATSRFPARDGLSAVPKGAVEQLVRGIAAEEGRFGVRANCVGPGMLTDGMATRLIANGDLHERALEASRTNTPLRTFGSAADIAEAVCFLASDRAKFISGQKLDVDGGYGV